MNRHWIVPLLAAVAAGALAFGVTHHAVCHGPETPLDALQDVSYLARSLDLSEAQIREITALHADLQSQLNDCCMRHCAARARLGEALIAGTNDISRTEAIVAEMCRAYEQSERVTLDRMRQVRAVLTADQRKRFDTMISDCMCRTCSMPGGMSPGAMLPD